MEGTVGSSTAAMDAGDSALTVVGTIMASASAAAPFSLKSAAEWAAEKKAAKDALEAHRLLHFELFVLRQKLKALAIAMLACATTNGFRAWKHNKVREWTCCEFWSSMIRLLLFTLRSSRPRVRTSTDTRVVSMAKLIACTRK